VINGLNHIASGKIRDLYAVGDDHLLLVASDRVSAYDHVLAPEIPDKGRILTQLSLWWFGQLADVVPNHVVSADVADYPAELRPHADQLRGRSMLVRRLKMVPVECVARGYLTGSGLAEYRRTGTACGVPLPPGLVDGSRLDRPIFTPATKAEQGEHDENVTFEEMAERIGDPELAARLKDLTLAVYARAREIAERRGIILADTKFEFGLVGDTLMLVDEVLTPDSSRFWPQASYKPGGAQPSFDKQFLRDYLLAIKWPQTPPPPPLPPEIVTKTRAKYLEAYERLLGHPAPFA
jgi:phosphoribosylaminoimidazole-succinocarboxamide synthase